LVALESTVITHGLPYPHNLALARDVEGIVRACGAEPRTIGIIQGELIAGLTAA
ncbi:MAG: pseudouridine-5'-phosphate glycosidase, partial [Caldilineaceae bacterium]|nr:pseudouridine-5'-phosphate glycosidase [Caldilineaceae bacterium]